MYRCGELVERIVLVERLIACVLPMSAWLVGSNPTRACVGSVREIGTTVGPHILHVDMGILKYL